MKHILIPVLSAAALLASCSDWTDPENKDFLPQLKQDTPAELAAIREFKASEHPLMMMHILGTQNAPNRQNQHPMAMPDSVDFLLMSQVEDLNPAIVDEIAEVRTAKGTRTLNVIYYDAIRKTWDELREEAKDAGHEEDYAEEKFPAYCKAETEKQLACCNRYGLDGVVASYLGTYNSAPAEPFVRAIEAWAAENSDKLLFFRGYPAYIARIEGQTLLSSCDYILILTQDALASVSISRKVRNQLTAGVPTDRVIIEASVPFIADGGEDAQVGAPVQTAAEWVMDPKTSTTVQCDKLGLAASNAQEDYFNTPIYKRIREAIAIMNPATEEEINPEI